MSSGSDSPSAARVPTWLQDLVVYAQEEVDQLPFLAKQRSTTFLEEVEAAKHGATPAEQHVHGLPSGAEDAAGRAEKLFHSYTEESPLYKEVNKALRNNDEKELQKYNGYIRDLMASFATLPPFSGKVYRGIRLAPAKAAQEFELYARDTEFVWASFTSTSTNPGVASCFSGGLLFEIICHPPPSGTGGGQLSCWPADIQQLSQFSSEQEVLLPPYTAFRVVNARAGDQRVFLETTADKSVHQAVEDQDWEAFEGWANGNPEHINTCGCRFSLINDVAAKLVEAEETLLAAVEEEHVDWSSAGVPLPSGVPATQPLEICLKHKADINEEDPTTHQTPLLTFTKYRKRLADKAAGAGPAAARADAWLKYIVSKGGNPHKITSQGERASDIMDLTGVLQGVQLDPHRWVYYIDEEKHLDGMTRGWYDFPDETSRVVDKVYMQWLRSAGGHQFEVKSGYFTYTLDFNQMTQVNQSSHRLRRILPVPA